MILSSISSNEACIRVNSLKKKKKGFVYFDNKRWGGENDKQRTRKQLYTRFVKSVVFVDERDFVRCEFVSSLYFYRRNVSFEKFGLKKEERINSKDVLWRS